MKIEMISKYTQHCHFESHQIFLSCGMRNLIVVTDFSRRCESNMGGSFEMTVAILV